MAAPNRPRWRFWVVGLTALVAGLTPPAVAAQASDPAASFVKVSGGPRDYWIYTPSGATPAGGRPLVVYLHGCTQADDEANEAARAFGTRWNELAEREHAVVVYPVQAVYDMENPEAVDGNGGGCWNWFLEGNNAREQGDAKRIADITRSVMASHQIDPARVFIAGTSAGADMTVVMGATYPDIYRAIAPFSGCAYKDCADTSGRLAYEAMGGHARVVPAAIFQGDIDMVNNYGLDQTLLQQQIGTADWADDGMANGSVNRVPTGETRGLDPSLLSVTPNPGGACVRNNHMPCLAGALGWTNYPTTVHRYSDAAGQVVVEHWTIHGLNHNYPYGDPDSTFTDPAGPDITSASYRFFTAVAAR